MEETTLNFNNYKFLLPDLRDNGIQCGSKCIDAGRELVDLDSKHPASLAKLSILGVSFKNVLGGKKHFSALFGRGDPSPNRLMRKFFVTVDPVY